MDLFFFAILIGFLLCGVLASVVAEQKQAGDLGFWFGLLLGPAGVIAAGFLDRRPNCSQCGGRLNNDPKQRKWYAVCPHCRCQRPESEQPELEATGRRSFISRWLVD